MMRCYPLLPVVFITVVPWQPALAVEPALVCRVTVIDTMYEDVNGETMTREFGCIPIIDSMETGLLASLTLAPDLVESHRREIAEGQLIVSIQGASLVGYDMVVPDDATFTVISSRSRRLPVMPEPIVGVRSLFVVRVSTIDATPDKSLTQLYQGMFASPISFSRQYEACSFGQLQWTFAGGIDVALDEAISNFSRPSELINAAQDEVQSVLGIESAHTLADHVVFCMPQGISGWFAFAGVNHWRVNVKNQWCLSLSALMHELAHNMGMGHSGEGDDPYGDVTGYMSYGGKDDSMPRKCFNGYKNYRFGWYRDHLSSQIRPSPAWFALVLLLTMIVWIPTSQCFFASPTITFSTVGCNLETQEKGDLVTVTQDRDEIWWNVGGLDIGDNFTIDDFEGSGQTLTLEVCAKSSGGGTRADTVLLSIGLGQSLCQSPTASPTPLPTELPTVAIACVSLKETCASHSDCCGDLRCLFKWGIHGCRYCREGGHNCVDDSECCAGLACSQGRVCEDR